MKAKKFSLPTKKEHGFYHEEKQMMKKTKNDIYIH
jgi:hypothetical protein